MNGETRDRRAAEAAMTDALLRLGLVGKAAPVFEPLTGGVSSDIFKVTADRRQFVVKRALATLRVAADWQAPIERNAYEYAWLETAARVVPDAVPQVLGHDLQAGLFAMALLDPEQYPVWKSELHNGRADPDFASLVGGRLAEIHAATAADASVAARFATDHIFRPIRLEPYLGATAAKHPEVADRLLALADRTLATKRALVHGDVSPKNILCGPRGPVFLDAECAWYGDPAFDMAFCLNHLLLKCVWNRATVPRFLACFDALSLAYLTGVTWESRDALETRVASLLPGLFLARVDGKSPVEYIADEPTRLLVRQVALPFLVRPPTRLADMREAWAHAIALADRLGMQE